MNAPLNSAVTPMQSSFDPPPIPGPQLAQPSVAFSQFLQQVQTPATPPSVAPANTPPAAPPPVAPGPPPKYAHASTSSSGDTRDSADKQKASSARSTPADAASDRSSTDANAAQPGDTSSPNTQTDGSRAPNNAAHKGTGSGSTKATGKGKHSAQDAAKEEADQSTSDATSEAANAAAIAIKATTAPKQRAGQPDKDSTGKSDTKGDPAAQPADATAAQNDQTAAELITTDPAGQAIAVAATAQTPPADAGDASTSGEHNSKAEATKLSTAVKQAHAATALGSTPLVLAATVAASTSAPSADAESKSAARPQAAPSKGASAPLAAVAADAPKTFQPPAVAPSIDISTADVASTTPQAAAVQAIATVATTEAQVVSTITVDPTTASVAAPAAAAEPPPQQQPNSSAPPNNPSLFTPPALAASISPGAPESGTVPAGLATIDRARFVQRVARAFQTVGDQGGQMRLRLSPPELGSLQMQITVKQGALTAHIQADNSTAQQVLLDSLPDLRDRLAQQDIRIERFDVELMGQSSGGLPQSPQGNPDFGQSGRRPASNVNRVAAASAEPGTSARGVRASGNGILNVVV